MKLSFVRTCVVAAALVGVVSAAVAAADPLQACYKRADTMIEVQACLKKELDQVQKYHDEVLDRVMDSARELDRIQKRKEAVKALTEANKAFARYVDEECGWVQASYGSGSGAGNAALACRINLLRVRAGTMDARFLSH
ncbi:MAG: lysozyme inhibitor LprI family protein [Duodenibacillus sp.]|nr:lysozyme inhibitor LprI family protein [Duodenibacillus sp.]